MTDKKKLVDELLTIVDQVYFDEKNASLLHQFLPQILRETDFVEASEAVEIARLLTEQMQTITGDTHLKVRYAPEDVQAVTDKKRHNEILHLQKTERDRILHNFGFQSVKILKTGVGYIRLTRFSDTQCAGEMARSVLYFVSNCETVIIDLRDNQGGHPSMTQLLASYFIEEDVLLCAFHYPKQNRSRELRSLVEVAGKKLLSQRLFLWINAGTFSAGEALAYSLQQMGRATVIGKPSRGGANICSREILGDSFVFIVPIGYPEDGQTQSNWEGTGVIPDIDFEGTEEELVLLVKEVV